MRKSTTFILAAAALASSQGCTAPAASSTAAAMTTAPMVEPPPPQPAAAQPPVVNRRLQFRNGPGAFISPEDYPAAALQARQQGTVRFRLTVSAEGRVTYCTILQSSGHSILDASICRLMRSRARFTPATDSSGNPVQSAIDEQYTWKLPPAR